MFSPLFHNLRLSQNYTDLIVIHKAKMADLIDQFIGITGCKRDQATEMLSAVNYDLAQAVELFLASANHSADQNFPLATMAHKPAISRDLPGSNYDISDDDAFFDDASDTSPHVRKADPAQRIQMVPQNIGTMYANAGGNYFSFAVLFASNIALN